MRSMTGYGKGSASAEGRTITVEIKTVNHKFFDWSTKMPRGFLFAEDDAKKAVAKEVARGHVDLFVTMAQEEGRGQDYKADVQLAAKYIAAVKELAEAVGVPFDMGATALAKVPDIVTAEAAEADDETLWKACEAACADEFLHRMPAGLDTDLGQGGVNVSGGQKQRLCIARTLLKQPKVLIFDDSTSAVDTATEAKIRAALSALPDVTKIVIAQRVTSVMEADMIVILDDGRIHAVGTHADLLEYDEIYQEIYYTQMKGGWNDDPEIV